MLKPETKKAIKRYNQKVPVRKPNTVIPVK